LRAYWTAAAAADDDDDAIDTCRIARVADVFTLKFSAPRRSFPSFPHYVITNGAISLQLDRNNDDFLGHSDGRSFRHFRRR